MAFSPVAEAKRLLASLSAAEPLKRGSVGWSVKLLRRCLGIHGVAPRGMATARNVEPTFNGEVDSYVRHFQKANRLVVDGIVGPQTWRAIATDPAILTGRRDPAPAVDVDAFRASLKKPEAIAGLMVSLAMFLAKLNPQETDNRSEIVDALNRHTIGSVGNAWCVMMLDFLYDFLTSLVGIPKAIDIGASSSALVAKAKDAKLITGNPRPGDIIVYPGGDTGWRHAGLVIASEGKSITTAEGNTHVAGVGGINEFVIADWKKQHPGVVFIRLFGKPDSVKSPSTAKATAEKKPATKKPAAKK